MRKFSLFKHLCLSLTHAAILCSEDESLTTEVTKLVREVENATSFCSVGHLWGVALDFVEKFCLPLTIVLRKEILAKTFVSTEQILGILICFADADDRGSAAIIQQGIQLADFMINVLLLYESSQS